MANTQVNPRNNNNPHVQSKERALLEQALEGKSKEFRDKVLMLVETAGLTPNDPMFLLLISTGRLEILLSEAPEAMERLFKGWTQSIQHSFDLVEGVILQKQELAIAESARRLIKAAEKQTAQRFLGSLVPAGLLLLTVLGLGFAMGITIPPYLQGGYVEQVQLTAEQAEALSWAQSKQGKLAKNLMEWNVGYLDNLECLKDAKKLKVVLKLGPRPAVSGFCTIWVIAPEKRRYQQE
ncbi:MAG TPA: DUF6753 family protein [Oculatellaceae cyanobacterium]|jgi:hypothetical protein